MTECAMLSLLEHPEVSGGTYRPARREDFVSGAVVLVFRIDGYGKPIDREVSLSDQKKYAIRIIGVDDRGFVSYCYLDQESAMDGDPSVPLQNMLDSRTSAYVVECGKRDTAPSADVLPVRRCAA